MRVIQILPTFSYGDAIGNHATALYETLRENGFETEIYAERIYSNVKIKSAREIENYQCLKDDLILYHLSTGSDLNYRIAEYPCKKAVIYHNITPPHFFEKYGNSAAGVCREGLEGARFLADKVDYAFAVSEFNKQDLLKMGYTCPVCVLPILINFDDYSKKCNVKIVKKYKKTDYVNIVFVGRIAPNKKHEDIIRSFYYYKKYWNSKSRLFLVGRYFDNDMYYQELKKFVKKLELDSVYFTGHIKFDEILSYYKIADVFLCLSEHEGFCVPLVESMCFDVPIIAYDSCAVSETLGGSGILVKDKNPEIIAGLINRIVVDKELSETIVRNQREALGMFQHSRIKALFMKELGKIIKD